MSIHRHRHRSRPLDMAIVGLACRFPGAADAARVLGEHAGGPRLPPATSPPIAGTRPSSLDPEASGPPTTGSTASGGGYLDAPIGFDPLAHGVMPLAVAGGEPEQFLVLDAARAALVDAG